MWSSGRVSEIIGMFPFYNIQIFFTQMLFATRDYNNAYKKCVKRNDTKEQVNHDFTISD